MTSSMRIASFASIACILCPVLQLSRAFQLSQRDPPPRSALPDMAIDPKTTAGTIKSLQKFIARSGGKASLVLMGDSTMAGMVDDLLNLTKEVAQERWTVHITNDRPKAVHFTNDGSWVEPGAEWHDPAALNHPLGRLIVKRSRAADRTMHSKNCTWGGGVETYIFASGDLKGLAIHHWGFLPEYGEACWDSCMTDAMHALKPTAVLWNIGLHLLNHDYDAKTCATRQNPSKKHCGDYKQMVTMGTRELIGVTPTVIWRTTNMFCEERQVSMFPAIKDDLVKWHDPKQTEALENECHDSCPLMGGFTCSDWLMDAKTTNRFYSESSDAIEYLRQKHPARASSIRMLDAYNPTRECCERGCEMETEDGEHYRGLDRDLLLSLAEILATGSSASVSTEKFESAI